MTSTAPDFRCSAASRLDDEPMTGTAPTEATWLLVEYAGPWGRQAVAESRLPQRVRDDLSALDGVRVQLVRRHGGATAPGVRVFVAHLGAEPRVWTTVLDDHDQLLGLDLAALASGRAPGLVAYDEPLWLVCTNGRRDLCCAEQGRPVAAALAGRWPAATWETTHLGGHRFAGTLLALPSGIVLGRLAAEDALTACADLEAGRLPSAWLRGRAGHTPLAQVAEGHVRRELGLTGLDEVRVTGVTDDRVTLSAGGTSYDVRVACAPGPPRRQSCGDLKTKAAGVYDVVAWGTSGQGEDHPGPPRT